MNWLKRYEAPAIGALLTLFGASLWLAVSLIGGCGGGNLVEPSKTARDYRLGIGESAFEVVFTDSTGLGPLFNGNSCAECHNKSDTNPILGGPGDEIERHMQPDNCLDPAIVLHELPTPEVATAPVGLRHSPDLFGLGHLDRLTDQEIKDYVASEPRLLGFLDGLYWFNTPELNINRAGVIGRFGRRAQVPTLREFIAKAFAKEMGVDEGIEISSADIDATADFVAALTRPGKSHPTLQDPRFGFKNFTIPPGRQAKHDTIPPQPPPPPPDSTGDIDVGRLAFKTIGCAVCHNPATEYTDLALHNLGERDICEGNGNEVFGFDSTGEFRTEPLTGLGLQTQFMHDGGSTSLFDAIERHRGEGGFSRRQFELSNSTTKSAILAFLRSL